MHIEIKIYLKPVVKKYLATKVGVSPFILSRTNSYGLFLYHCLVKLNDHVKQSLFDINTDAYSEEMKVRISEDMWRRKGWFIHPQKQIDFNTFVLKLIDEEFYYFMDINTRVLGQQNYTSYLQFREKFDISEDELPVLTLKKRWERHTSGVSSSKSA